MFKTAWLAWSQVPETGFTVPSHRPCMPIGLLAQAEMLRVSNSAILAVLLHFGPKQDAIMMRCEPLKFAGCG